MFPSSSTYGIYGSAAAQPRNGLAIFVWQQPVSLNILLLGRDLTLMLAVGGGVETCSGLFLGGVTPEVVEESAGCCG